MKRLLAIAVVLLAGSVLFAGSKFEIPPPSAVDGDGKVEADMDLDTGGFSIILDDGATGAGNGAMYFGQDTDLNIFRSAANTLRLEGSFTTSANIQAGGFLTAGAYMRVDAGGYFFWTDRSHLYSSGNGIIELTNHLATQGVRFDTTVDGVLTYTDESAGNLTIETYRFFAGAGGLVNPNEGETLPVSTVGRNGAAATGAVIVSTGAQTNVGNYDSGDMTIGTGATTTDGDTGDIILDVGVAGAGIADSGSVLAKINGVVRMQVCGADGSVEMLDASSDGAYWREFHIPASKIEPAAAGATPTVINAATFVYLLNADTEYLYFGTDIHDDWDASSDMIVEVQVALSGAETADDVIQAEIVAEYVGEHEDIDTGIKTQTRSIDHDIDALATQGDVHHLTFVLDHDLASHVIQVDDNLSLRFRLDVAGGAGNVAAIWFKGANIKYRTSKPQLETGGTFPSEG